MSGFAEALTLTPALYPIELSPDGRGLRLIRLDEAAYARASFLDGRLLLGRQESSWADWPVIGAAARALQPHAHFIFHIGHVGSTLLSRLLGEHPALFSVREPALLREVAAGRLRDERDVLLALFSRVWRPGQTALIKATSFVSVLGPALMQTAAGGRAILLSTTPPNYLRAILGGPASREEAQALAAARGERLARRLEAAVWATGEGEVIAMSWLCEALSLFDLAHAQSIRSLWLDFDVLLGEPEAGIGLSFAHLGVDPEAVDIADLVRGPLMRRYSKGPEHAYDAELRRRVLEQAGRDQALEVRRGMDWLQRMHAVHPAVGHVLRRAAAAARAPLAGPPPPV